MYFVIDRTSVLWIVSQGTLPRKNTHCSVVSLSDEVQRPLLQPALLRARTWLFDCDSIALESVRWPIQAASGSLAWCLTLGIVTSNTLAWLLAGYCTGARALQEPRPLLLQSSAVEIEGLWERQSVNAPEERRRHQHGWPFWCVMALHRRMAVSGGSRHPRTALIGFSWQFRPQMQGTGRFEAPKSVGGFSGLCNRTGAGVRHRCAH